MKNGQPNISQQLNIIIKALERFPEGASLEAIREASGLDIEIRTLQRRINKLKAQGIVMLSGKTRGALYRLEGSPAFSDANATSMQAAEIPLSKQGKEIREAISKPVHTRHPVGYNPEFLNPIDPI